MRTRALYRLRLLFPFLALIDIKNSIYGTKVPNSFTMGVSLCPSWHFRLAVAEEWVTSGNKTGYWMMSLAFIKYFSEMLRKQCKTGIQDLAIQDADEFVSSSKQKCCITSLAHQWMGAIRMRVQTADKNITIVHNSNQSISTCPVKWKLFVKIQIHH